MQPALISSTGVFDQPLENPMVSTAQLPERFNKFVCQIMDTVEER
jgi:hypothetical protein